MSKKNKKWTEHEVQLLKENYQNASKEEILKLLKDRTWESIKMKAWALGLKRNPEVVKQNLKNTHKSHWERKEVKFEDYGSKRTVIVTYTKIN